jgi:hypothetical protein
MLPGLAGSILPPEGFYGQRGTAAERIAQNSRFAPGEAMWPVAPRGHQERRSPSRDSRAHQLILVNCFSSLWIVALAVGFAPALTASHPKNCQKVATDLYNPRGLAFGADRALYVAEAESGSDGLCAVGPHQVPRCLGTSGAIMCIDLRKRIQEPIAAAIWSCGSQRAWCCSIRPVCASKAR